MSSTDTNHDPTPEFQAALRRTVTDALRRETEFAHASRTGARVPLYVGMGVAASAILVAGIVLGASTGLASAEVLDVRQREVIASNVSATRQFAAMRLDLARTRLEEQRRAFANHTVTKSELAEAEEDFREMTALVARIDRDSAASRIASLEVLRRVPAKSAWSALACGAAAIAGKSQSVVATPEAPVMQSGTRTVDLPPAGERSAETIGAVMGLNELSGSRVLVNDSRRRQVRIFDSTLATSALALDSVAVAAFNYGSRWAPLLRYRGDSSILIEMPSRALRVLDGRGQVVRTLEPPSLPAQLSARSYVDERGRLLYTTHPGYAASADSTPIIRLDLTTRSADTVAHLRLGGNYVLRDKRDSNTTTVTGRLRRALRDSSRYATMDDWAVLSNGTIAIMRGGDYRLDLIRPDGVASSVQVPVDSSRIAARDDRSISFASGRGVIRTDTGRAATDLKNLKADMAVMIQVAGDLLGDQSPRSGSTIPDLDGNLWILPPYASATLSEPLVYDVVNGSGTLVQRVRLPAGQWIAGFGKGGTVYLISGTRRAGYYLERTRFRVGGR